MKPIKKYSKEQLQQRWNDVQKMLEKEGNPESALMSDELTKAINDLAEDVFRYEDDLAMASKGDISLDEEDTGARWKNDS